MSTVLRGSRSASVDPMGDANAMSSSRTAPQTPTSARAADAVGPHDDGGGVGPVADHRPGEGELDAAEGRVDEDRSQGGPRVTKGAADPAGWGDVRFCLDAHQDTLHRGTSPRLRSRSRHAPKAVHSPNGLGLRRLPDQLGVTSGRSRCPPSGQPAGHDVVGGRHRGVGAADRPEEVLPRQADQVGVLEGGHRRGARDVAQEADLAEELARALDAQAAAHPG